MKRTTLVGIVVLVLVALAGAALTVQWQRTLATRVHDAWAANEALAESAPQQTAVGTWSIRDAVLSAGSMIVWSAVFLAACICASATALLLKLDALHRSVASAENSREGLR